MNGHCHCFATKDSLRPTPTNQPIDKWHWWCFILAHLHWSTYVVGCRSICVIIVQSAHSKLQVVRTFTGSVPYSGAGWVLRRIVNRVHVYSAAYLYWPLTLISHLPSIAPLNIYCKSICCRFGEISLFVCFIGGWGGTGGNHASAPITSRHQSILPPGFYNIMMIRTLISF